MFRPPKNHATTSAASAAAMAALVRVTGVLSIKRTPPKALCSQRWSTRWKTALLLENTKNEPLGAYPVCFFTMKKNVKEMEYKDIDEARRNSSF